MSDPSTLTSADLPLVRTRTVGGLRIHALDAGLQRLDGGAMFGVVPKPLWERRIPADERNRIPLALRCLLVEAPEALVLIDTGVGNKEDAKFRDIYGIDNEALPEQTGPTRLEAALAQAGFAPDDIDLVVLTHLHFDHAGGATLRRPDGSVAPAFPQARHAVEGRELDFAHRRNERIRASYVPDNLDPLTEAGLWHRVDVPAEDPSGLEITRGVRFLHTPGHTPWHQSVLIESAGETACFLADLCPTTAHLPLPWIMGYDLEPLRTLESKRTVWERARAEDWLLVMEHDPHTVWGRLDAEGRHLEG